MSGFSRSLIPVSTGYAAGDYIYPVTLIQTASGTPSTSAVAYAYPFYLPVPTPLDRISMYLVTAQTGGAARVGLYTPDYRGRPSTLIVDGGELDLSSGGGALKEATISVTLMGLIWGVIWLKNIATQVTVRGVSTSQVGVPGLLPGSSTLLSAGTNVLPCLQLVAAYPASMPTTAGAFATGALTSPVLALRAA